MSSDYVLASDSYCRIWYFYLMISAAFVIHYENLRPVSPDKHKHGTPKGRGKQDIPETPVSGNRTEEHWLDVGQFVFDKSMKQSAVKLQLLFIGACEVRTIPPPNGHRCLDVQNQ